MSYVGYYLTLGHTPVLEFIDFSFVDFLTTHSTSWPLWVVILGHTPILEFIDVLQIFSHYSIHFLIFASHHTGAYPLLALFYWGIPPLFGFTVSHFDFMVVRPILSIFTSYHLGHSLYRHFRLGHPSTVISFRAPPTVISHGASPHCHFRLGHLPTVIFV